MPWVAAGNGTPALTAQERRETVTSAMECDAGTACSTTADPGVEDRDEDDYSDEDFAPYIPPLNLGAPASAEADGASSQNAAREGATSLGTHLHAASPLPLPLLPLCPLALTHACIVWLMA